MKGFVDGNFECKFHTFIDTYRPCHTIAYRTSVCQRMKNITHTPVYADIR